MSKALRAVYENGLLRLLDPVSLTEGQTIRLVILSEREQARAALKYLLVDYGPDIPDDIDEAALWAEIDTAAPIQPPVSDAIIEERREGP